MSSTIRLRPATHKVLKEITELTGRSMQDSLDQAVEDLRRRIYLEGLSQDYSALRSDKKASKAFDAENSAWDKSSSDGLEGI
jgi:hypothetical protein